MIVDQPRTLTALKCDIQSTVGVHYCVAHHRAYREIKVGDDKPD
jgi:hypothetical protein